VNKQMAIKIIRRLADHFNITFDSFHTRFSPFELLISTIISQNTNWRNTQRAFENLKLNFSIDPKSLALADISALENALKIAGLHRVKARVIKYVSQIIHFCLNDDLSIFDKLSLEEARKILLLLPGIGYKTADILLLFSFNKPVFPIDTHIFRVTRRIGFVQRKVNYENLRQIMESLLPADLYKIAHISLIMLGRQYCRPKNPKCNLCPIRDHCLFIRNEKL